MQYTDLYAQNLSSFSNSFICALATDDVQADRVWTRDNFRKIYKLEAEKRGINCEVSIRTSANSNYIKNYLNRKSFLLNC